jgi:CheY-like chemotaxis protein
MESIGQLTGGIAHDFNNMLAGIVGAMHLLQRRAEAKRYDELPKYIDAALDSANRAAALTSRLLSFGRRASLDMKAVDVAEAIHGIELILRRTVGENIKIKTSMESDNLCAVTDINQLQSTLLNLTINARDAMPDGGELTIAASNIEIADAALPGSDLAAGKYVLITVADSGVGMEPEVLARAFDPFFTTKPIGAGTGLGLSMVYGFLKQANGFARIESELGKGTTVFMYLPAGEHPCAESGVSDQKLEAGQGETVLVVEDEHLVRLLVTDVLHELGYTAFEAKDAQAALPILQSAQRLDLLITDVGLPGMNGRQLADVARQRRPDIQVLFLTGYAEHAAVRSGFLAPGMELMTKPFAIDELSQKIRDMIGKSSVSAS